MTIFAHQFAGRIDWAKQFQILQNPEDMPSVWLPLPSRIAFLLKFVRPQFCSQQDPGFFQKPRGRVTCDSTWCLITFVVISLMWIVCVLLNCWLDL